MFVAPKLAFSDICCKYFRQILINDRLIAHKSAYRVPAIKPGA